MQTVFEVTIRKGDDGSINVFGLYKSGTLPLFIERVNLSEMDSAGSVVCNSCVHVRMSLDPVTGSYLLMSKPLSGANVVAAQAKACYLEIDKSAQSPKTALG
jgi:hypothetical protein